MAQTPIPGGARRYVHSAGELGGIRVPVVTPDLRGDVIEGHIRVPVGLVGAVRFTKRHAQLTAFIAAQVKRWVEWREHKGWELNSTPKVSGPFPAPVSDQDAETPDWKLYVAKAVFKPRLVLSVSLDEGHELQRVADLHGIDTSKPKPTDSGEGKGRDVIVDRSPNVDPLVVAEERRQAMGVKRSDYLIGPLDRPMSEADLN